MKNVFLDLGTHYGQGLREFVDRFQMNDTWSIHTFEANPHTQKIFLEQYHHLTPWVISYNAAVSDHNGTITVNLEKPPGEGETGMGTSVIDLEKWNPWGGTLRENFKTTATVSCIDLSDFIFHSFNREDNIVVKMDIEGSEYDTLERMISTGAIEYLNFLTVEWHSRFFTNVEEMREKEDKIIDTLRSYSNLTLESWK